MTPVYLTHFLQMDTAGPETDTHTPHTCAHPHTHTCVPAHTHTCAPTHTHTATFQMINHSIVDLSEETQEAIALAWSNWKNNKTSWVACGSMAAAHTRTHTRTNDGCSLHHSSPIMPPSLPPQANRDRSNTTQQAYI
jgi:hypothetical protein